MPVKDWLDDLEFEEVEPQVHNPRVPDVIEHHGKLDTKDHHPLNFFGTIVTRGPGQNEEHDDEPEHLEGPPGLSNIGHHVAVSHPPRSKVKEAESIKIAALPDIVGFEAWKIQVRKQVMAASGRRDEAFQWIMEVKDPDISYEDLGDCSGFETLDMKLSAAILSSRTRALLVERSLIARSWLPGSG